MTDAYRAEQAEAEISRQEAIRQQEMERQLAQSQPAKTGDAATLPARSESEAMRAQLQDRPVSPQVMAEQRLDAATPAGMDAPEAGQMTNTPIHTQDGPDCMLQSARMAEHRQTGIDPGLEAYKTPAMERGIYNSRDGVTDLREMTDVINNRPGIEAELTTQQTPEDIQNALNRGESVIVGVDSYEFYKDQVPGIQPGDGGHAVVVTSAEQQPNGKWEFTVNDPNSDIPNLPVDGDKFINAWNQADRPMVAVRRAGVV